MDIHCKYFTLLVRRNDEETSKEIEILTNPFNTGKIPSPSHEYKIGDVLMNRFNFNIARVTEVSNDWYTFDRRGMDTHNDVTTFVHKNSVEPSYLMRKVDIDLPALNNIQQVEVKND